jgi:hypothetical protein
VTNLRGPISSSLLGNFHLVLAICLGVQGCGESEAPEQTTCENLEAPDLLSLADVTPAEGSSVANRDVVHAFTVVGASAMFSTLTLAYTTNHDAGAPDPLALKFTPMPAGENIVYSFEPVTWEEAGHVELIETSEYSDGKRCYILPRPLFSYDVTE